MESVRYKLLFTKITHTHTHMFKNCWCH